MTPKAAIVLAMAAVVAVEGSAFAQYDRDGRYVPSPMGVPQDPYAAPIPMYPGTPGGAVGTPLLPRAAVPETPVVPPLQREPQTQPLYPSFVPLTLGQCGEPWSRATKVTPTEFRRRCASMRKHQENVKRKQEKKSVLERPDYLRFSAAGFAHTGHAYRSQLRAVCGMRRVASSRAQAARTGSVQSTRS